MNIQYLKALTNQKLNEWLNFIIKITLFSNLYWLLLARTQIFATNLVTEALFVQIVDDSVVEGAHSLMHCLYCFLMRQNFNVLHLIRVKLKRSPFLQVWLRPQFNLLFLFKIWLYIYQFLFFFDVLYLFVFIFDGFEVICGPVRG